MPRNPGGSRVNVESVLVRIPQSVFAIIAVRRSERQRWCLLTSIPMQYWDIEVRRRMVLQPVVSVVYWQQIVRVPRISDCLCQELARKASGGRGDSLLTMSRCRPSPSIMGESSRFSGRFMLTTGSMRKLKAEKGRNANAAVKALSLSCYPRTCSVGRPVHLHSSDVRTSAGIATTRLSTDRYFLSRAGRPS